LFFVYSGSLFSVLYVLRLYNLSRGIIFLSIVLFPILSFLFIILFKLQIFKRFTNNLILKVVPVFFLILFIGIFLFQNNNPEQELSIDSSPPITVSEVVEGVVNEGCSEWKGSDNFTDCITGTSVSVLTNLNTPLTNVILFDQNIYVLQKNGLIFNFSDNSNFLDLSSKVGLFEDFAESGLFSLAFHPKENYFLVSYSDKENNLIIEKFQLDNFLNPIVDTTEILMKLPNSQCCHYSGNIIWSNYFNDFLISVGDMQNKNGLLHSDPLDTTSPKGKVLFLNKKISNADLLSLENSSIPRQDILAYGLRNPWKTYEYKNYLFIPDVGKAREEELNIVNLDDFKESSKPFLFGWPHFEGTIYYDLMFNQILYHNENSSVNIREYIKENTLLPHVYYSHEAPENYRAAIIGGGVIQKSNSKYFEHYFFADYLSNEMFSYDFANNELKIMPLKNLGGSITSMTINTFAEDEILITTASGRLVSLKLP